LKKPAIDGSFLKVAPRFAAVEEPAPSVITITEFEETEIRDQDKAQSPRWGNSSRIGRAITHRLPFGR